MPVYVEGSLTLDRSVADPGKGPRGPAPRLFLYQTAASPPLSPGLDDQPPPPPLLSEGLDPPLQVTYHCRFVVY